MRRLIVLLAFVAAMSMVTPLAKATVGGPPSPPLGIPVPQRITPGELLAPSTESGDVQGPPGVRACDSADRRAISLPTDDRPHNSATYLEWWWWWYGIVTAQDGRRFAVVILAEAKPSAMLQGFDYTIADLQEGSFHYGREPLVLGQPALTPDGFRMTGQHASVDAADGVFTLHASIEDYDFDLMLHATKPAVAQFGDGNVNALCNNVYWYTQPAMRAVGTVSRAGEVSQVTGVLTFDHMWGFDQAIEGLAWSWWTMHLSDGRDVELVVAQPTQGDDSLRARTGFVSQPGGEVVQLHASDFTVVPTRYWQRDASCAYPVEFDATVLGEQFHIKAAIDSTEVRALHAPASFALWPGWPIYWDGATRVTGSTTGEGWTDLGHYCPA